MSTTPSWTARGTSQGRLQGVFLELSNKVFALCDIQRVSGVARVIPGSDAVIGRLCITRDNHVTSSALQTCTVLTGRVAFDPHP